jgi:hypothetical protein
MCAIVVASFQRLPSPAHKEFAQRDPPGLSEFAVASQVGTVFKGGFLYRLRLQYSESLKEGLTRLEGEPVERHWPKAGENA